MNGPPPDGLSPTAPRSTRRRLIVVLSVLLVLLFVLPWIFSDWISERARLDLEERLARAIGGEARIGEISVRPRRLELRFRDVLLQWPSDASGSLRIAIAAGRIRLTPAGLVSLARGTIHLAELELEAPDVEATGTPWDSGKPGERQLEFELDRLGVRDGRVRFDDFEAHVGFTAEELLVHAARDADGLAGNARMRLELRRPPGLPALLLDVDTGFRLHRNDIELVNLAARGRGLDLQLAATIALLDDLQVTGRGRATLDLSELAPLLGGDTPCDSGILSGPFSFERGPEPLHVRSQVEASALTCAGLELDGQALAHYTPERIEVHGLRARTLGGQLLGDAEVTLRDEGHFDARLRAEELRSQDLLRWLGLPIELYSHVTGQIELQGILAHRETWQGQGTFTARPERSEGGVRIEEPARLVLERQRLHLEASAAELDAARLDVDLGLDLGNSPRTGSLSLEGSTANAGLTHRGALRVLDRLGVELPARLRQPLAGQGRIGARFDLGPASAFSLDLDLADGSWGSQPFREARVALVSRPGGLSFPNVSLITEDGTLQASGALDLEPLSLRELDLRVQDLDVPWLLQVAGFEIDLEGRLQADLRVATSAAGLSGSGSFRMTAGRLLGEPVDVLAGRLVIGPERIALLDAVAEGPVGTLSGEGEWSIAASLGTVRIGAGRLRLGELQALRGAPVALEGDGDLQGELRLAGGELRGKLDIQGTDWRVGGYPLGRVAAVLEWGQESAKGRFASLDEMGWLVEGQLSWAEEALPYRATIELDGSPVDLRLGMLEDAWARLEGRAEIEGELRSPGPPHIRAALDHAEIHLGVQHLETSAPVQLELANGRLSAGTVRLVGDGVNLEVGASGDVEQGEIEVSARGTLDLALASAVLPDVRAAGQAELDLRARGSVADLSFSGSLKGTGGRLRWLGFPQGLEQMDFALSLEGQRIRLEELRARLGNGEIRATGSGELEGLNLKSYVVSLDGANVRIHQPEGFRGTYDGDLELTGGADGASLAGRIRMSRGVYDQRFDLTRVLGFGVREYGVEDETSLPDIDLDLAVTADGNVWVDNDVARVESSFDIHVGGTLPRPEVTGRLWMIEGGRIVFRDVQYTITSGSLDFVELTRLNPYLTLRATAKVEEYTILLRIEGTLDKFEYDLTSEPTLSTQDIIALLTTGRTLEELSGQEAGEEFTGDVAANYFAGALTDPLSRQMEQLLKIEKIEINPVLNRGDADPTTQITLGERVGDNVSITLSSDIGGNAERYYYEVEWRATEKIGFTAEQDTLSGIGGAVRYSDRFWWHRPAVQREAAVPDVAGPDQAPTSEDLRVQAVEIEGVSTDEQRELLRRIPLAEGRTFSRSGMLGGVEAIRWYYVKRDHIEATVDARTRDVEGGVGIVYHVVPGPTTELLFEGIDKKEARRLLAALQASWADSVYTDDLYRDSIDLVRDHFQQRGYYAVDVQLDASPPAPDRRRIVLRIDPGKPVRVQAVLLHGVIGMPEERIRQQMLTRPTTLFARRLLTPRVLQDDLAAIRSLYRDQGYLDVRVEPPRVRLSASGEYASIDIHVDEGARHAIAAIGFVGANLAFPVDQLREWSGLEPGSFVSPRGLLEAESRLRSRLDQAGYPDSRVRGGFQVQDRGVRVEFTIEPGMPRRIAEIVILGNRITREKIIRREIDLQEGDGISRESLLQVQHRLYRLGIFRSVQLEYRPVDGNDPTWQRLEVRVVEAEPFATALGLGYDAEAGARVDFSLSDQNVGGYNRAATVQGRFDDLESRLQLVVTEPRLFAHQLTGMGSLSMSERKEPGFDERRRAGALRVDRRFGPIWSGFMRYGLDHVELSNVEDEIAVQEERLENLRLGDLSLALIRSTLDNPFLPRKGSRLNVGVSWFGEALLSQATFLKTSTAWAGYRSFSNGIGLASSVRLGAGWPFGPTERIPLSERYFAGGASTVRGFERDELGPTTEDGTPTGGEALLVLNEEFRFPIWRNLRGVLFYDAGNVFDQVSDVKLNDLRHVLGAGLRLETPVGPLRLEYGGKLDREPDESRGEWFLSIGAVF